jgi:diguanylate cyclase (GGDEF)-like protein
LSLNHLSAPQKNYAKRLIAVGIAVTLGFSAILGFVLWESRSQEREQARQAAYNVIATMSSEIDRNLEIYDLSLQAVVDGMKLPELSKLTPELRQMLLFDRAATAKDMGSIFILNENGTVIVDSRTLTPRADSYAQSDFFLAQKDKLGAGPYLSRPWLAADGEYLIAISRRLSNPDGSFSGVVVGTLRLSYFEKMFSKVKLGDHDALILVREDGSMVMRSPLMGQMIGRNLAASSIFQKTTTYLSGSFEDVARIDGVKRMYVYQHVGEQPLTLCYGISLDSIYAAWRQKAWLIGSLMLVMCAINIALIVFLTRALRRRSEAEYQLSIVATTDGLTKLCNRGRLDEVFDIEWRRAQRIQDPIALLMIDADNFKNYNDQFGHQAGDAALLAIAHCIETNSRRATDICARYGGEEFAVLLPGTLVAEAVDLAEKIRASLLALRADQQGRPDSTPTVSIGAASIIPRQGLQPRDLIKAADTALYEAKCNGRNRTEAAHHLMNSGHGRVAA